MQRKGGFDTAARDRPALSFAQAALVYFWHWPKGAALAGFILPNVLINFVCRKFLIFRN